VPGQPGLHRDPVSNLSFTCKSLTITYFPFFFCLFRDMISLCSSGWPRTHNPPASASQVLGL
jgi:hypothetical protein